MSVQTELMINADLIDVLLSDLGRGRDIYLSITVGPFPWWSSSLSFSLHSIHPSCPHRQYHVTYGAYVTTSLYAFFFVSLMLSHWPC